MIGIITILLVVLIICITVVACYSIEHYSINDLKYLIEAVYKNKIKLKEKELEIIKEKKRSVLEDE